MQTKKTYALVLSALCLSLALVLPFLTAQLPELSSRLLPMHFPVLLCGFLAGPVYGAAVGAVAPVLRSVLFGRPVLFPMGVCMAAELLVYGLCTGLFYRLFPKKVGFYYLSLFLTILLGRLVYTTVLFLTTGIGNTEFSFLSHLTVSFVDMLPGLAIQFLFLVPIVALVKRKNG